MSTPHSAPASKHLHVWVDRPGVPRARLTVARLPAVVGQDPGCDLHLEGPGVEPRHLELDVLAHQLIVTDLSRTGVAVNGDPVRGGRVAVAPGATIALGEVRLRLQLVRGDAPEGVAPAAAPAATSTATRDVSPAVRRAILRRLLDRLELARLDRARLNDHLLRVKVERALHGLVEESRAELPAQVEPGALVAELVHEAIGLGPLDQLLADDRVTEIMVLDATTIYVERGRTMERSPVTFTDDDAARAVLERIIAPLGRRIDESSPMLDARLADGSRVNAVIRPLALRGTCITIRKFPRTALGMADLLDLGSLSEAMARFLTRSVRARKNVLISGGTGSGKTTLLNVLSRSIGEEERVVTIEDAAELRLQQHHVVSLEARPPNMEGHGEITIRDLVKNAMRMRPDRIIIGECRGGEAVDMLQAMNTGHDGSMTTTHANSPAEAVKRIEMLAMMAGLDVPSRALREQIGQSIDLVVQQARLSDGSRRVTSIAEVDGVGRTGEITVREIFGFRRTGTGDDGRVVGEFYATGYVPSYLPELVSRGLIRPGEPVL